MLLRFLCDSYLVFLAVVWVRKQSIAVVMSINLIYIQSLPYTKTAGCIYVILALTFAVFKSLVCSLVLNVKQWTYLLIHTQATSKFFKSLWFINQIAVIAHCGMCFLLPLLWLGETVCFLSMDTHSFLSCEMSCYVLDNLFEQKINKTWQGRHCSASKRCSAGVL